MPESRQKRAGRRRLSINFHEDSQAAKRKYSQADMIIYFAIWCALKAISLYL